MEENQTALKAEGQEANPAPKPSLAKPEAKPKAPAKPKEPLVDNGDGTINDPNTGLMWKQTDAWLDMFKFYTWFTHREYVDHINREKFAGYDNWRIPSKVEAMSLHDKEKECLDKNASPFFVDPIFAPGGVGNTWISECADDKITRYDWKTGVDTVYPTAEIWASMRLVRKEGEVPSPPVGDKPDELVGEAGVKSAQPETSDAKQASAVSPPPAAETPKSGQAKPGPTPKEGGYSDEEKVVLLKRAKAHAAAMKAKKG